MQPASKSLVTQARPIYVIGAGSIVRDAHLPAYRDAGFPIAGIFDIDTARAETLARETGIVAFKTREELFAACVEHAGVLDLALPPAAMAETLRATPKGAVLLLQKPFGRTLAEATELLEITRERQLRGAVNFQLRHAPCVEEVRALVDAGAIGEAIDVELRVVCTMPWETWPFMVGMERMEVLMHSIHYLDLVRAFFGEPAGIWCSIARHPLAQHLADTRSTTVMNFGEMRRAVVTTFHHHRAPQGHDASHLKIEGTRGTIVAQLGVNLDYPRGRADHIDLSQDGGAWKRITPRGNWFPHAFAGSMHALQRLATGVDATIESSFEDAWRTMALVETCYRSANLGERVPDPPTRTAP